MIIQLLNEQISLSRETLSMEEIISAVNRLVENKDFILTGMDIDGFEIYDSYEESIQRNLNEIKIITLNVVSKEKMEKDIELQMRGYISRALPALEKLVEALYQSLDEQIWNEFADFVEGADWIIMSLEFIKQGELINELSAKFLELNEAVENQDSVLMADLLMYEIKPLYEIVLMKLDQK